MVGSMVGSQDVWPTTGYNASLCWPKYYSHPASPL
jgi:hypothetical protein